MATVENSKVALEEQEVRGGITYNIRQFSIDVAVREPELSLAACLELATEKEGLDRSRIWRRDYEDEDTLPVNPVDADIDVQCKELEKYWKEFLQSLESEQDEEKKKKSKFWKSDGITRWKAVGEGRPVTFDDIVATVSSAEKQWKEKDRLANGKAQRLFHSFCKTLSSHSSLFEMLPNQSQYCSIFCGAVKTLIKASINHQKTAEGLADALVQISAELDLCVDTVRLMNVVDMRQAIGNLYSHIFHLLRCAMQWFQSKSWKKVLNSLTEDFFGVFEDQITKIKNLSSGIVRKSYLKSQAELRDLRLLVTREAEQNAKARAADRDEQSRSSAFLEDKLSEFRDKLGQLVGQSMSDCLRTNVTSWLLKGPEDPQTIRSFTGGESAREQTMAKVSHGREDKARKKPILKRTYAKSKVQAWSRDLQYHISDVAKTLSEIDAESAYTEPSIVESLQDWGHGSTSQSLWIRGIYEEFYPSSTSAIAAKIVKTALDTKIPLLYFFCNIPEEDEELMDDEDDTPSKEEAAVIDFLYSLIRQAIELLPREISTKSNLTKPRFARLDGTLDTFDEALNILADLLLLVPSTLLIVIDGIEQLDDTDVDENITDILKFIQDTTLRESSGSEKVVKILYTTAGPCSALDGLDDENLEVVRTNERKALRSPGNARKGRILLDIDFDSDDNASDDDPYEAD